MQGFVSHSESLMSLGIESGSHLSPAPHAKPRVTEAQ